MRRVLTALPIVAWVLANVPLAVIALQNRYDWPSFWRIVLHSPAQFLFCFALLPVAAVAVVMAATSVLDYVATKSPPAQQVGYRRLLIVGICLVPLLAAVVGAIATSADGIDISGLEPPLARRVAQGTQVALGLLRNPRRISQVRPAMNSVPLWSELMSDLDSNPTIAEAVKQLNEQASTILPDQADSQLVTWLMVPDSALARNRFNYLPLIQIAYDEKLFQRVEANQPGLRNTTYERADILEITADLIIGGELLLVLIIALRIRTSDGPWQTPPAKMKEAIYALYLAFGTFAIWVALRVFAIKEITLVTGSDYGTYAQVIGVGIVIMCCAIYLLLILSSKPLPLLFDLVPVLGSIVTGVAAVLNPQLASRIIGSDSSPASVAVIVVAYLVVIVIWMVGSAKLINFSGSRTSRRDP